MILLSVSISDIVLKIRYKLAKKEYEAGKLYLKLEEYTPAIIYFNTATLCI